jgi:hypothetical protein
LVREYEKANPQTQPIYAVLIVAALLNEISQWILQQILHSDILPPASTPASPVLIQHLIFGGILMLETHPDDELQLAFLDSQGSAWEVSQGSLLFKIAEGPDGMPFSAETPFQRRRLGVVKRIGGLGGGLES